MPVSERVVYPKPPIVEAIVELHFASEVSSEYLADSLQPALSPAYAGERSVRTRVEISANLADDEPAASARNLHDATFLRHESGSMMVGCSKGRISLHALPPYPGWPALFAEFTRVVSLLPGEVRSSRVEKLSVRYINRIEPLESEFDFSSYLHWMPSAPAGMPTSVRSLHFSVQSKDADDGTLAACTVATALDPVTNGPILILDIALEKPGPADGLISDEHWVSAAAELHKRKNMIFESSITPRTKELFQ